jgi:hypothetical protein
VTWPETLLEKFLCIKGYNKAVYGNFNYSFYPLRREEPNFMLLATENVGIAGWSARLLTAHVVAGSCRKSGLHTESFVKLSAQKKNIM